MTSPAVFRNDLLRPCLDGQRLLRQRGARNAHENEDTRTSSPNQHPGIILCHPRPRLRVLEIGVYRRLSAVIWFLGIAACHRQLAAPTERDLILESTMRKRMALLLLAACCAQAAQRFDVVVYGATA